MGFSRKCSLAILFALVIGVSMWALLVGEYMNSFMNEQTRHTVRIVGFAGVFAALVTWWVQNFAAKRSFLVRFMFAFFVFVVAFCSFGGRHSSIAKCAAQWPPEQCSLSKVRLQAQLTTSSPGSATNGLCVMCPLPERLHATTTMPTAASKTTSATNLRTPSVYESL